MSDSDSNEFEGSLFPVFVTAKLPLELINEVLKRAADYTAEEELDALEALVLVDSADAFDPTEPTEVPVTSFSSPFIGKSLAEIRRVFEEKIAPGEEEEETPKAASVFMILDERTAKDKTVLIASLEGAQTVTVRAEPEITAIYAMGPEMGTMSLGEGANDARGDDGVIVLTEARYRRITEEDLANDSDDYDEDEDESEEDEE